jgi:hypothetical protein
MPSNFWICQRTSLKTGSYLLEETCAGLEAGDHADHFWRLVCGLNSIRESSTPEEWSEFIGLSRAHPIRSLLEQEPYTKWSYSRPRGYMGDARLIDYLYLRGPEPGCVVSDLGLSLHQCATRTPGGFSVRARRDMAAQAIDAISRDRDRPSVLAVACGHLREAERSVAVRERRLGRFIAVDQDPLSVGIVANELGGRGVDARCQQVADFIRGERSLPKFDLIYALGLYDYLSTPSARALTQALFNMLTEGGSLLFANFVPGTTEAGYMEAFMRWTLIYRSLSEMEGLCDSLSANQVLNTKSWTDDGNTIAYVVVQRT